MKNARRSIAAGALTIALLVCSACGARRASRPVAPRIGQTQSGIASWYGVPYHGRRAANGEVFDMNLLTAAHRTFAFGTWVRVHNLDNGKSVDVRITDRGPFVDGRVIDLSRAAAGEIGMLGAGLAKVRLEVIPPPPDFPREKFTVQTGAFRDRSNAERNRDAIENEFGDARIVLSETASRLWLVVTGEYDNREEAERAAGRIRGSGREAVVLPVGPLIMGRP